MIGRYPRWSFRNGISQKLGTVHSETVSGQPTAMLRMPGANEEDLLISKTELCSPGITAALTCIVALPSGSIMIKFLLGSGIVDDGGSGALYQN